MQEYEYVVIGAGFFGVFTALRLAKQNVSVLLIDKESKVMQRASLINQARVHGGYHYPRSYTTAKNAHDNKLKFLRDHQSIVKRDFKQYYGFDKYSSYTSPEQFESFCHYLKIPLERVHSPNHFKRDSLDAVFVVEEYTVDLQLMNQYYTSQIKDRRNLRLSLDTSVQAVAITGDCWDITLCKENEPTINVRAHSVINATYSNTNGINRIFKLDNLDLCYEITEIVLARSSLHDVGLTVMDGDFLSFMPYGYSGLTSISSVRYTRHYVCDGPLPVFPCQALISKCTPYDCLNCNTCQAQPKSNHVKMVRQIYRYLSDNVNIECLKSMFTIKSKCVGSYIDDSRPTVIRKLHSAPDFHCIFGGKLSSVYEIEYYFKV